METNPTKWQILKFEIKMLFTRKPKKQQSENKRLRFKFISGYVPPVRYRFYSKYANGITLWVKNYAVHIWYV